MREQGESEGESDGVECWPAPRAAWEMLSPVSPGLTHRDPDQRWLGVEPLHHGLALHLQGPGEYLLRQQNWDGGPGDCSPVRERIDRSHVSHQGGLFLHLDRVEEPGESELWWGGPWLAGEVDKFS